MDDPAHFHLSDVWAEATADGAPQLFAGRRTGYAMVVTGDGASLRAAQREALRRARSVCIPDLRFRADIGARVPDDVAALRRLGWFDAPTPAVLSVEARAATAT